MKNLVELKEEKWYWPKSDENSWKYQNEYNDLAKIVLPYVKNKNIMIQAGGNCGYLLNTFVKHFNFVLFSFPTFKCVKRVVLFNL